jgi:hypothetical protein
MQPWCTFRGGGKAAGELQRPGAPIKKRALVETGIGAGWLREMARTTKVDGATNGTTNGVGEVA